MFKHSISYIINEDFIDVDSYTKEKIKKIKLNKDDENYNNFDVIKTDLTLREIVNKKLKPIFDNLNLKIVHSWVQQYKKNNFHSVHTHFNTQKDFSFVWFIDGSKESAPIIFYDIGYPLINSGQVIKFPFKPGILLIFPGFIPHEVPINKTNNRLIISGNAI